jgi:hypothetical protein
MPNGPAIVDIHAKARYLPSAISSSQSATQIKGIGNTRAECKGKTYEK